MDFFQSLLGAAQLAANNYFHPQQPVQRVQQPQQYQNAAAYAPKMLNQQGQQQWMQQHMPQAPQAQPQHFQPNYIQAAGQIGHGIGNVLGGIVNDAAKGINTGLGAVQTASKAIDQGVAQMTGNQKLANYYANQKTMLDPGQGLLGQGGLVTQHQFKTDSPIQALGKGAAAGVHYSPYFMPYGAISKAAAPVAGAVSKVVGGAGGQALGKAAQYGTEAALNAPIIASQNAADQAIQTGKFNPMEATKTGIAGGLIAGGAHAAGDMGTAVAPYVQKGVSAAANKATQTAGNVATNLDRMAYRNAAVGSPSMGIRSEYINPTDLSGVKPQDVAAAKKAILNGQPQPLIVTTGPDGYMTLRDGHATLAAYNQLGIESGLHAKQAVVPGGAMRTQGGYVEVPGGGKQPAPRPNLPNDIGKALGMSEQEIKDAKNAQNAPLETPPSPKTQETIKSTEKVPTDTSNSAQNGKYSTNNTKVSVDTVNPGDYQKVRSNVQRVQANVNVRAREAVHAINKLAANDKSNFWHVVEGTAQSSGAKMDEAIGKWHQLSDYVHAASQALGGDTPHLANYARHNWDLSDPKEAERFTQLMNEKFNNQTGHTISPEDFKGLDNKPRAFDTIKQGQAAGFKLANEGNPAKDVIDYVQGANGKLKTQTVAKGMQEAESHLADNQKGVSQHIGYKSNINVSQRGAHELRSLFEDPQPKYTAGQKVVAGYDSFNKGLKQTLLSLSQFHTGNIGMQTGGTLLFKGHPIRAVKAAVDTAASTFSPKYSDSIISNAIKDGTIDKAAQIGTPIMDGSDFNVSGKLDLNAARGEKLIFERQLPAMHIQMARAVISDLEKKGIPLDSPKARAAGNEVHQIMGYVNSTLNNMSARNMRGAGRVMLAPNFTLSKWRVLGDALTKGGQAGAYARSAVVGKYAMEVALMAGIGAIVGQKSDNMKDLLLRALVHPSIPTPFKDSKGNTMELGLPHNYVSEALGLTGALQRNSDGHLGINFKPGNIPSNLESYAQGRLATLPSMGLKLATNQNYAGKPLYDPNAPLKSQAAQAATTLATGELPIGLQNAVYTQPVKNVLGQIPGVGQDIKSVLDAGTPGANPLLKGIASSLGATARTDKTVGKGLQTTQYFDALNAASQGLNSQEKAAMTMVTGGKKNPVTGAYDIAPTPDDSRAKATALLQNPKVIDNLMTMNQTLAKQGQSVDPLWLQSKDNIMKYYQYQAMPPGGPDRIQWQADNGSWSNPLANQRNQFFSSLPKGDPNKPQSPIQYPTASQNVQQLENQFFTLAPNDQATMIKNNPDLLKQFQAQHDYTNALRKAQGYDPLKGAPQASDRVNALLNMSKGLTGKAASAVFKDPEVAAYMQNVSEYNLAKNAALDQFQGNTLNQKALKAAQQIGNYDLIKNPDGTLALASGSDSSSIQPGAKGVAYNKYSSGTTSGRSTGVRIRTGRGRSISANSAAKSLMASYNRITKNSASITGSTNKRISSAKIRGTKARLPSTKAAGVKLASFKKVSAAPKISMKRRT